ncbi:MAG: 4-hydroxythreonine-4-phosphate dehydrogenase PdxA [Gammaproteobacteria bacterium]|nr:4-hydroxythreonine-4-phosphate dehydrogenase PdxA [Gammaproteobacteria bacterium]
MGRSTVRRPHYTIGPAARYYAATFPIIVPARPHVTRTPTIVLTPGEPAGIGPDLAVLAPWTGLDCRVVVAADPELLAARAALRERTIDWPPYGPRAGGPVSVLPVPLAHPATPGRLDPRNAPYVLETLRRAVQGCLDGEFDALVTGPVNKAVINEAGIDFSGHTEYLAALTGARLPVMMLASGNLRVPLVTTHLPLREVADHITPDAVRSVIEITHRELSSRFGIASPRIAVCGLNPHAGEGGYLGREEIDIIRPVIEELVARGLHVDGPLPADTIFTEANSAGYDAVVAMYHDQGLPALKRAGFGRAVNITLGLPVIRVSVDHGTALDRAGTGTLDTGSLRAAFECALRMAESAGVDAC